MAASQLSQSIIKSNAFTVTPQPNTTMTYPQKHVSAFLDTPKMSMGYASKYVVTVSFSIPTAMMEILGVEMGVRVLVRLKSLTNVTVCLLFVDFMGSISMLPL